jgi:hypothetical protein
VLPGVLFGPSFPLGSEARTLGRPALSFTYSSGLG